MKVIITCLLTVVMLGGCGIEDAIKRNDDRYMQPGALDLPLTGYYDVHAYKLLDRYRIRHEWPTGAGGCAYRGTPTLNRPDRFRGEIFVGRDIFEENGKTWLRFEGMKPYDFDRYVRSVISEEKSYTDAYGQRKSHPSQETGFRPLCFESWWTASHSLSLRLHKLTLAEFETMFTKLYPEGRWSSKTLDGRLWRVQETDRQHLRPRRGVGGPYQTWVTTIGDTGYVIALEMTASQDSLAHPQFFDALEAVYRRLIGSLRIEPLPRNHP